jgi:hypothetical protein
MSGQTFSKKFAVKLKKRRERERKESIIYKRKDINARA